MTRPFRLRTVERLRGLHLDATARALAVARATVETARGERDRLVEQIRTGVPTGTVTPDEVRAAGERRDALREAVTALESRIVALDRDVAVHRERWLAARAALRAVQELHARHRRAAAVEAARAEQRESDDLALSRWTGEASW